jgi:NAD(P)-dependent dehydrogenase (short-subunit alcohol dehydrogenase family)
MAAVDVFGSLGVVINNAAYGNLSSVEDTPLSLFLATADRTGSSNHLRPTELKFRTASAAKR